MNKLLTTLSSIALLTASSASVADPSSEASTKLANINEFQYEQAFVSPPRQPLVEKDALTTAAVEQVTDWQQKNAELQARGSISKDRDSFNTALGTDFWIYDSWTSVSDDFDYDGYYTQLNVEFDADTVYTRAYVYAVIYLGIGDVFESLHVTSVFAIDAQSSLDSFVVESELISGYPPNDYEVLIELYDADTDELVALTDGYDDADLAFIPLESENYEVIEERVVIIEEHGGSLSGVILLLLAGIGLRALRLRETH
ncbi:choice-of-anchor H family protein [Alteromonas sp. ASW11-36]|uniref:Choice-of-anchor H family protein n=1 Tax=Alteromonas arenosi TaxID=3055817 RepID=A0ABT7STA9_9ALTE|nr:choice-of-anchor H family protein [Alteromonas sp. ASW11-36]MDM7859432.1 choice-of-anchor H family protein [Alteromonas sp. ASW11-36]